ncbi:MAG TPA: Flp family type IVb pilin [Vitreimonas sp.]|uniref:Flp family type IVb pilin n=1 Tax=Vitreimonas sp. TaxID=3069702 RepID=UPI002D32806F|nr:Flp family type IVb pilin [Vitreimonas sp.]HYD87639.1 Flp family type IVb pilin [Vitreimonas sp.]
MIKRFCRDESGATAIEYALLGALLSLAVIASVTMLGDELRDLFNGMAAEVAAAT